jgi:translation initiation factor 2B subunit (eIF-2B alpha/beta/delta family)
VPQVRTELESSEAALSAMAAAHVHAAELILTHAHSRLAARFLRAARHHTHFRLLLAEGPDHAQVLSSFPGIVAKRRH